MSRSADDFSTLSEGVRGKRAVDGRFVDAAYPTSKFQEAIAKHAQALAAKSDRPASGPGITLGPALVFAYRAVQHIKQRA